MVVARRTADVNLPVAWEDLYLPIDQRPKVVAHGSSQPPRLPLHLHYAQAMHRIPHTITVLPISFQMLTEWRRSMPI